MADDATVDLAFAGAGWIAAVHGYAVRPRRRACAITKVASRDPERAAAAAGADATPSPAPTTSSRPAPTASSSARRRPSTLEHALHALAGGAGVLIEKPLCTTLDEADALVAAAEAGALHRLRREPRARPDRAPRPRPRRPARRHRPRRGPRPPVAPDLGRLPHRGLGRRRAVRPRRPPARRRAAPRRAGRARRGAGHPRGRRRPPGRRARRGHDPLRHRPAWPGSRPAGAAATPPPGTRRCPRPTASCASSCCPRLLLERNGTEVKLPGIPEGVPAPARGARLPGPDRVVRPRPPAGPHPGARRRVRPAHPRPRLRRLRLRRAATASGSPSRSTGPRDRTPLQLWRG